jgi:hypothetical protein
MSEAARSTQAGVGRDMGAEETEGERDGARGTVEGERDAERHCSQK